MTFVPDGNTDLPLKRPKEAHKDGSLFHRYLVDMRDGVPVDPVEIGLTTNTPDSLALED